jgi:Uma2 family endonuclease
MTITDPVVEERLKEERRVTGADRYDEVWEGVYIMTPLPNNEHQWIAQRLATVLQEAIGLEAGQVFAGVNLSDLEDGWEHNFRCPDVAAFLRGGQAVDLETHWRGPADFLVEIASPDDNTRGKIPFYGRLGVRELLIIDRDPWRLELLRHVSGSLELVGTSELPSTGTLASEVVPLTFRLIAGETRPAIEVVHTANSRRWTI